MFTLFQNFKLILVSGSIAIDALQRDFRFVFSGFDDGNHHSFFAPLASKFDILNENINKKRSDQLAIKFLAGCFKTEYASSPPNSTITLTSSFRTGATSPFKSSANLFIKL